MQALDTLFGQIRSAVPAARWSTGVELARAGCVSGESYEEDEITLRVLVGSRRRSFEVTLWPDDEEWQCDCPGGRDKCEHVAAGIIALRQARQEGSDLPEAKTMLWRLAYRLTRDTGQLAFRRFRTQGDEEMPHEKGIVTDGSRDGRVPMVTSQGDLLIERAMSTWRFGRVPRRQMAELIKALSKVEDVTLDGVPVRALPDPLLPSATVTDQGQGFLLKLIAPPGLIELFTNGAVLSDAGLHVVGTPNLDGGELRDLERGRFFSAQEASQLVATVLPRVARAVTVDIQTTRLPTADSAPPRLVVETSAEDDRLFVLPTVVYGDPAFARIDRGKLVMLSDDAVPYRDTRAEQRLVLRLGRQLNLEPGRKVVFEGEEAVAFTARLEHFSAGDVVGEAHEQYYLAPPLVPSVSLDGGSGAVRVTFTSDGEQADSQRVVRAWQRGLNVAPLDDGGWAPIPHDWLRRFGPHIAALLEAKRDGEELPASAFADVARLAAALDQPLPPRFERLKGLLDDFSGLPVATLPDDLRATLRGYQQDGVDWLSFLGTAGLGAMLADDMGLGKTLQTLCAVRGRTLVVAPTSVLYNWRAEAQKFRPSLTVSIYHGPKRELDEAADLTLTTYAIMRLDIDKLSDERWDTIVLDEAQTIKNPSSQVAQAAYRLKGDFRIALTGTPVENRLSDLWSQFHFLNPGLLGGRTTFDERYATPIADGDGAAAGALRERIRPFLLRRLKREVASELPPRTDVVLRCELTAEERATYDAIRAATKRDIVEQLGGGSNVLAALEALLRLRQAACHRGLVPGQTATDSSKVQLLLRTLDAAVVNDHKALVFSQWTGFLDRVEPHLNEAGIAFCRLDGATRDRQAVVDQFQSADGPPVMLLSLKAGGTGLNLTAADHVFMLDPWWNPAVEDQAADRAHRIGQQRPVLVHRIVATDTVEERILALQDKKRMLAEVATGAANQAGGISRDELLALLE